MPYNLIAEIAKKKITKKEIAKAIGISQKTLFNKLNGKTDFTMSEMMKIRDTFFPGRSLEELFELKEPA